MKPESVITGNFSKKNDCVSTTQWLTSGRLKIMFDPSLDRFSCELFKISKDHGLKNPPSKVG